MALQFLRVAAKSPIVIFLNRWRITSLFGISYVLINYLFYVNNGNIYPSSHVYTFLTSWFNWSENWDYTSVRYGFLENFGLPFFFILMAEYYARNIQQQRTKNYLSIDAIFAIGVMATYIMTGLDWYFLNQSIKGPFVLASGSSVVAFTFFATYLPILVIDTFLMIHSHSFGRNIMASMKHLLTYVLLFCLVAFGVLQDSADMNHIVGLCVFSLFAFSLIASRYHEYKTVNLTNGKAL